MAEKLAVSESLSPTTTDTAFECYARDVISICEKAPNDESLCEHLGICFKTLAIDLGHLVETAEAAHVQEAADSRHIPPLVGDIAARARLIAGEPQIVKTPPLKTKLEYDPVTVREMIQRITPLRASQAEIQSCFTEVDGSIRPLQNQTEELRQLAIELNTLAESLYLNSGATILDSLPETVSAAHKALSDQTLKDGFEASVVNPLCEAIQAAGTDANDNVIYGNFTLSDNLPRPTQRLALRELDALRKAA